MDEDTSSFLRSYTPDILGQYDGQWVVYEDGAVQGAASDLDKLLEEYRNRIVSGESPLFAFVNFQILV